MLTPKTRVLCNIAMSVAFVLFVVH